ncbi:ATP-binding protein [Pseudomonas sp. nanlin1]|uniref:ATP-binding protein n=1 Tax=Pseudomonas sp. nanlin1 TaxID=3040605 RepID=UPI00388D887B
MLTPIASAMEAQLFTEAEREWMRQHPTVRYAIDPYWPMEYVEGGQLKGLTREYLAHIERISGLRFERVETPDWQATLDGLANGQIDLSTAVSQSLLGEAERKRLLLTEHYFAGSSLVITRFGEPIMYTGQKLNGKIVAIKGGGGYERYLREHYPAIKLRPINDVSAALTALAAGEVDAVVGLDSALQPMIRRQFLGTLHVAGVLSEMPVVVAMGVSPLQPPLRSIIDKSFSRLTAQGTDSMVDRWIAGTDYGAPSWGSILRYYLWELAAFALFILLLALFAQRARRAQRAAQDSEADKSAFLAMMSHEVRTPMNAVLSAVELLGRTPLQPSQRQLAELASHSAVNLLELLDGVLDASRLQAGKLDLAQQPLDLIALAEGVAALHRLGAEAKGVSLACQTRGLQGLAVQVDPLRMRQILSNLLSNAVKFTPAGAIRLNLEYQARNAESGTLRITVSDSGIGIDEHQQADLFKAFAQADRSTSRRYGGSGLGLSICKQLVELMGGQISLHSRLEQGTSVTLTLPVAVAPLAAQTLTDGDDTVRAPWPARILVVEDQPVNQQAIAAQLQALGYHFCLVEDGPAALAELASGQTYHLMLLDCYLPGMDGYSLAGEVRQREREGGLTALPIIAISAATDAQHRLRCADSGIDAELSKPLRLGPLSQLLAMWLAPPPPTPAQQDPMVQLQQVFLDACAEDLEQLKVCLAGGDTLQALHHTHRIHGSALTVGARSIADIAHVIEQRLREDDDLGWEWQRALNALEDAIRSWAPGGAALAATPPSDAKHATHP